MRDRQLLRPAAVLIVLLIALAACGDDEPADSASPTTTDATTADNPADTAADEEATTTSAASGDTPKEPVDENPLFDFVLDDVRGGSVDGTAFAGSDVVIWFWAPWCTKCNQEAPSIAEVSRRRDDVRFLGMAGLDDVDAAADFVARHGLGGFPHAFDERGDVWQRFGITTQSSFAFVDDDGTVETTSYTVLGSEELNARIDALLAS